MTRRWSVRSGRGAAAIELAIALPLLVLVIMGLVDFGRLFFSQIGLGSASREGARAASIGLPAAQVQSVARASAPAVARIASLDASELTVTSTACSSTVTNENTRVTVTTTFRWMTPIGLVQVFDPASARGDAFVISSESEALCIG
jgi:Flp pilus assembly protein TadG